MTLITFTFELLFIMSVSYLTKKTNYDRYALSAIYYNGVQIAERQREV